MSSNNNNNNSQGNMPQDVPATDSFWHIKQKKQSYQKNVLEITSQKRDKQINKNIRQGSN